MAVMDYADLVIHGVYEGIYTPKGDPDNPQKFTGVYLGFQGRNSLDPNPQIGLHITGGKYGAEIRFFDLANLTLISLPESN